LNLLLDTHAVIWWFAGEERMPTAVRAVIAEAPLVYVSAISAYEIRLKHRFGKLGVVDDLISDFDGWLDHQEFEALPLRIDQALMAAGFEQAHRDPFDRMLIAQALLEDLAIVSNDTAFDAFGVNRIW